MNLRMEHIRVMCEKLLLQSKIAVDLPIALEWVKADGYKKDNTFPIEGWQPAANGQRYYGKDSHYWIRSNFTTPVQSEENRYLVLQAVTGKEKLWNALNPQGLLYMNGEMIQGLDTNHTETRLEYDTDYKMHLYFYLGMLDNDVPCTFGLYEIDSRIEKLYYDLQVPYEVCQLLKEQDEQNIQMQNILERCVDMLDMRDIYSEAYFESIAAADAFLQEELYGKMCSMEGKPIVNCIGHTHIDVEWQWTRYQTIEKIQRSFATAANLMKYYPEYKFMLTQPELYRYLKEAAPEKYAELKELVKEGRWEPEGAMYVEADCNVVSGESLVRQILQGKRFFKEEFGVDCKVLFLPDVFGYSAALPQILTKSGIRHFVTSKISWNDTNKMPVDTFLWQGIDGTEIFTNFITTQLYSEVPQNRTSYNGQITPSWIKGSWQRYSQKDYSDRTLTTFGFGDGGGGPTKEMLENYKRLSKGLPGMPVAKIGFMLPHLDEVRAQFDANCKKLKKVPKWVGELYLEFHRGTYTSMARNKRGNRKSEFGLQMAETLSMIDMIQGGSYDAEGLYANWRKVLHDQFHDIIPGSSIKAVYDLSDADYAEVKAYCDHVITEKLSAIAGKLNTKGGVMVYNPLGFARKGMLTVDGRTVETKEAIPAFGWTVVQDFAGNCDVTVKSYENGTYYAENPYYCLTLDNTGAIISLYDKCGEREVFLSGFKGNELQVFEDFPNVYDNWEISKYYKQKMWLIDNAVITPIADGSRAGFCVEKNYMNSTIKQNIWLYSDSRRIDFETEINWHEQHQILKAAFPFDIHTMSATYEIQYGHVTRPTHENTSWDEAKFEVYGHKWVDVSENGYGVSLLNDCKYGFNTEGSTLKMTILKCGTFPNPEADQGKHVLTYSLLPHTGDLYSAGVIQEAYALNQPLVAKTVSAGSGTLPDRYSLASCDRDNVIIETIKKAEDSDALILRMYEAYDRRDKVTVRIAKGFEKAYLCDLMENELEQLDFDGESLTIPIKNFEIVTIKFVK